MTFQPEHDGRFHTYHITIPAQEPVIALRLDPAQGPGEIRIQTARVTNQVGDLIGNWLGRAAEQAASEE